MARGGSKGIKRKNLKKIDGKPLIYWTVKYCLAQKFISNTWVSSDNDEILKYVKKIGAKTIVRPKTYSQDSSSVEPGLLYTLKEIERNYIVKNVFFLQATSPVRQRLSLSNAYKRYIEQSLDSLFSGTINHNIFFSWRLLKKLFSNYNYKSRPRRQNLPDYIIENGSFYIFNANKFKKFKNRLFGKIGFYNQDLLESYQIDDLRDFNLIQLILKNKIKLKLNV